MSNHIIKFRHSAILKSHLSARWYVFPAYIIAIAAAEISFIIAGGVPAMISSALLIMILLNHYALATHTPYHRILPVLALIPLLRILSLVMPLREVRRSYWLVLIGIPILIAIMLTARMLKLSPKCLGLDRPLWRPQLAIAISGMPLSIAGFLILRPNPLIITLNWGSLAIGIIVLIIFSAFMEEILFRGLLHQVLNELYGRVGIVFSSLLFAIVYFGTLSWRYVLFIGLVGLFFGWCVDRSRSIWGVVLAHGFMNIGMALVWPFAPRWMYEAALRIQSVVSTLLCLFPSTVPWLGVSGSWYVKHGYHISYGFLSLLFK